MSRSNVSLHAPHALIQPRHEHVRTAPLSAAHGLTRASVFSVHGALSPSSRGVLARRLPKLHTLSVCGCLLGANDTYLPALETLPRLTDLDLSDCPRITRNATKELLRNHNNRDNLQVRSLRSESLVSSSGPPQVNSVLCEYSHRKKDLNPNRGCPPRRCSAAQACWVVAAVTSSRLTKMCPLTRSTRWLGCCSCWARLEPTPR